MISLLTSSMGLFIVPPMLDYGIEFNHWWRSFIRILYPASCILCKTPLLLDELHLCVLCRRKIQPLRSPLCLKCAHPLPPYDAYKTCSACRSDRPRYDRGFALVEYDEPNKAIFHQIKFEKKPWLFEIYQQLLLQSLDRPSFREYEMIIPVPLDGSRKRKRGFNQAQLIAEMIQSIHSDRSLPIRNLIKKVKKTTPQSQLHRNHRLTNLKGVFALKESHLVEGKKILLVDDIATTGSTLNECAHLLKENGAEQVDFFTIARSTSI